ncbi:MAG: BCCT family transporter, partial [Actinomycetota bacterium]|nr:BCCT family transporter [Actinomycetota bacterium]
MGLALVFWGVSEPVTHYSDPPFHEAEPNTTAAAQLGMQYSFFHWGLHAWAVFGLVGLAVAYFNFRRDARGIISPIFYPILGERVNGPIGKAIDIIAILVTLIGVAVSLGQGGLQIGAGFETSLGFSNVLSLQLITIIAITAVAYMLSAATPINVGVKWLSNISFIVGGFLVVYFLIVGPTVTQINSFTQGIGDYVQNLLHMSLNVNAFNQDTDFLGKFTGFFWGWWITWAPFVGVFAARISRGRTIREFVLGMLIVPSLICAAWFAIVGGAAVDLDQTLGGTIAAAVNPELGGDPAAGFFAFLQYYPLPLLISLVSIFMLWIFFVAGADAGTIVLGEMSVGGITDPNRVIRLAWGVVIGAMAFVLLAAGGLDALRQAALLAGVPFAIIMILMCYTMYKALRADYLEQQGRQESGEEMAAELAGRAAEGPAGEPSPPPKGSPGRFFTRMPVRVPLYLLSRRDGFRCIKQGISRLQVKEDAHAAREHHARGRAAAGQTGPRSAAGKAGRGGARGGRRGGGRRAARGGPSAGGRGEGPGREGARQGPRERLGVRFRGTAG